MLEKGDDQRHYFHHYLLAQVDHGKLNFILRPVRADLKMRVIDFIEDNTMEWGLLLPAVLALFALCVTFIQTSKVTIIEKN